ncbi:MAG: tRNA (uridine(54)-C5)-methyltransferase TrmA [Halioglobus sp.]|nr:tRNA (uridine(54)-C5)-methyltransferase TrmA [Halioglobus sp.]
MPLSRVQPQDYAILLAAKVATVRELMAPFSAPEPEVHASTPVGFRLRAEFRLWHDDDDLNYVMFRREEPRTPVVVNDFIIADDRIQYLMPLLREKLIAHSILRYKIFQVEFLVSLSGDVMLTLIYHRKLDQAWDSAAQQLATALQTDSNTVCIVGRSRKQKRVIGEDFVRETLPILGTDYHYRQYEQSFSQPNGQVNIRMIEWACKHATAMSGDLLELYCGNGNFTLPLSRHFDSVIATELSKVSIKAVRINLEENRIDNVQVVRLSAEEVTQAMNNERPFRRLANMPKPLSEFDLGTLFVDPPRAGLDEQTVSMANRFDRIFYVSCNPQTLAQNLHVLCDSHHIKQFALFDQFPYTDHMECGVLLQKN